MRTKIQKTFLTAAAFLACLSLIEGQIWVNQPWFRTAYNQGVIQYQESADDLKNVEDLQNDNPSFWPFGSGASIFQDSNDESNSISVFNYTALENDDLSDQKVRFARSASQEENSQTDSPKNEAEAKNVLDLLKKGEETVNFQFHEDAILVLGNTGSGKSTFTQYITGHDENLVSYENEKDSGDFVIGDVTNKISNASTITSWTVFPEKVVDIKTNTIFYDCPGFSDTRGVAHDIAATYFTKEVLKHSNRVKLVFTINFSSVRIGVDRQDFMEFAEHVATVIQDISKFNKSIALIVTKVDNQYKKGVLVPDGKVIQSVAGFLKKVRSEVQRKISDGSADGRQSLKTIVKFIEVVLEQEGDYYPKIGIFRRPDESGPLNLVSTLREGKNALEKIIHSNVQYVKHDENDFGYTISAESKVCIHNLVEVLKNNIIAEISGLNQEVEDYFSTEEGKTKDIQDVYDIYNRAHSAFGSTGGSPKRPREFVDHMTKTLTALNISSSDLQGPLSRILNQDRYLEFFVTFGARTINPSEWAQEVSALEKHLSFSESYYNFLLQLFSALSSHDVQRYKEYFAKLATDKSNDTQKTVEILLTNLPERHREISKIQYDKISREKLDDKKTKRFESLLNYTLNSEVDKSCVQRSRMLTVKGNYVRLAEVASVVNSCLGGDLKFLEISALEKVFIDADLDLTGKEMQVSIIAPTIEVIGSHKIILNGLDGPAHSSKKAGAWSTSGSYFGRSYYQENGFPGEPGFAGLPAGKFLGIGQKVIDGQLLHIFANGGNGGPGQNGGDGSDGLDGTSPDRRSPRRGAVHHYCDPSNPTFLSKIGLEDVCVAKGHECTDGGSAGIGGEGGRGGISGAVVILGTDNTHGIQSLVFNGKEGVDGNSGKAGRAGQPGRALKYEDFDFIWQSKKVVDSWNLRSCKPDEYEDDSWKDRTKNSEGIEQPRGNRAFVNPAKIVERYTIFAKVLESADLRRRHLEAFLKNTLENSELLKKL